MRCKNCGWPNKPGATHCSKCNSPLIEVGNQSSAGNMSTSTPPPMPMSTPPTPPTPPAAPAVPPVPPTPAAPRQSDVLSGTVFENDIFPEKPAVARQAASPVDEGTILTGAGPAPAADSQPTVCPKCGYPLRPDTDKCPNCRFQIKSVATASAPAAPEPPVAPKPATPEPPVAPKPAEPKEETIPFQRQATVNAEQAFANAGKFSGTINPLVQPIVHEFKLTLVPRQKEVLAQPEVAFEGESVSLNREKVDPNNSTITSREQACISYEDGKWFIEDKSSFQTTFVRAGRKTELRNGDVILMGDRMFVFGSDQED